MTDRPTTRVMGQLIYLDECLMGVRRGAHQDGAHICPQFLFHKPANHNDVSAFNCESCGRRDSEHIVVGDAPAPTSSAPSWRLRTTASVSHAGEPSTSGGARYEACAEAARDDELDEFNDPLAIAGGGPPRRSAPAPALSTAAAPPHPAATSAATAAPPTGDDGDAFKAEVERLVQAEVEREQREAAAFQAEVEALVRQQPTAPSSWGVSIDTEAFLCTLGLEQHLDSFRRAGTSPAKLAALLRVEKAQCEQKLKELGVKSLGHRIRIVNALKPEKQTPGERGSGVSKAI